MLSPGLDTHIRLGYLWACFSRLRKWRNWQTRWIQVPVAERLWGFESPLSHPRVIISLMALFLLVLLKRLPFAKRVKIQSAASGLRPTTYDLIFAHVVESPLSQTGHQLLGDPFFCGSSRTCALRKT